MRKVATPMNRNGPLPRVFLNGLGASCNGTVLLVTRESSGLPEPGAIGAGLGMVIFRGNRRIQLGLIEALT